jgi:hypothetical protein
LHALMRVSEYPAYVSGSYVTLEVYWQVLSPSNGQKYQQAAQQSRLVVGCFLSRQRSAIKKRSGPFVEDRRDMARRFVSSYYHRARARTTIVCLARIHSIEGR